MMDPYDQPSDGAPQARAERAMLTAFQRRCLDEVIAILGKRRLAARVRVAGIDERYVTIQLSGDLTLYIYEDGAEVAVHSEAARLEREDFKSLDELQSAFVAEVVRQLDRRPATPS